MDNKKAIEILESAKGSDFYTTEFQNALETAIKAMESSADVTADIGSTLTANQRIWLKNLLTEEAEDMKGFASNYHLAALGSEDQETAMGFEIAADERREYANILRKFVITLGLED